MKINQQKIEKAVETLDALRAAAYPDGFPKEMKGDISSFGASIIQAGLLPSVLFFSEGEYTAKTKTKGDDDTKLRRARLMKVLFDVLEAGPPAPDSKRPLLDFVRKNLGNADALDRITEAALAVKMALRAFQFDDKPANAHPTKTPAP